MSDGLGLRRQGPDLDAIEAKACAPGYVGTAVDVLDLTREVRHQKARVAKLREALRGIWAESDDPSFERFCRRILEEDDDGFS